MSASRIIDGLWVGSAPVPGDYTKNADVIVLTAEEYQPADSAFPGVRVRRYPFDDSTRPSDHDLQVAWTAAQAVDRDLLAGRRVLVTCQMGRNRSAFVAGLALCLFTGMSGAQAMSLIRSRRVDAVGVRALSNPAFARILEKLPAKPVRAQRSQRL